MGVATRSIQIFGSDTRLERFENRGFKWISTSLIEFEGAPRRTTSHVCVKNIRNVHR